MIRDVKLFNIFYFLINNKAECRETKKNIWVDFNQYAYHTGDVCKGH